MMLDKEKFANKMDVVVGEDNVITHQVEVMNRGIESSYGTNLIISTSFELPEAPNLCTKNNTGGNVIVMEYIYCNNVFQLSIFYSQFTMTCRLKDHQAKSEKSFYFCIQHFGSGTEN